MTDEAVPQIISISPEDIAKLQAELGITKDDVPAEGQEQRDPPVVIKRKRGRPRKHPLPEEPTPVLNRSESTTIIPPAPLTKRDEREVSNRLENILTGGTGILSVAKPYLKMTDEEAKAIAEPLSSYLVRNADTIPVARQVLENYDLLAITFGVMAYVVRVYHDRTIEVAEIRSNAGSQTLRRISRDQEQSSNGTGGESVAGFVSTPYAFGDGASE